MPTLHPQAQAMLDAYAAGPALDYQTLTITEFRKHFEIPSPAALGATQVHVEDRHIAGAAGPMRVRVYRPRGSGPFPITLYLFGGGFVVGRPETTDGICRTLAEHAECLVLSPEYRLAPEAPFPAGLDDAWAALCWAREHAPEIDGLATRIAVAGDSSGGNFAAVLAHKARDAGLELCQQLLLYPVLDHHFNTASYTEFASGYFLTQAMMRWYSRHYLPEPALAEDWRASPLLRCDLPGLAPATIFTAECDVLRDEAEAYAARLAGAGVEVRLRRWPGQIHGFLLQQGHIDAADSALHAAAAALRAAFQ